MAEEEKGKNTYLIIIAVCGFLVIGLVSILKARETEHLSYSDNTSVQQEAELYKGVKDYNNVFE